MTMSRAYDGPMGGAVSIERDAHVGFWVQGSGEEQNTILETTLSLSLFPSPSLSPFLSLSPSLSISLHLPLPLSPILCPSLSLAETVPLAGLAGGGG